MTRYEEIELDCMRKSTKHLKDISDSLKVIAECLKKERQEKEEAEKHGFLSNQCRKGI